MGLSELFFGTKGKKKEPDIEYRGTRQPESLIDMWGLHMEPEKSLSEIWFSYYVTPHITQKDQDIWKADFVHQSGLSNYYAHIQVYFYKGGNDSAEILNYAKEMEFEGGGTKDMDITRLAKDKDIMEIRIRCSEPQFKIEFGKNYDSFITSIKEDADKWITKALQDNKDGVDYKIKLQYSGSRWGYY